MKTPPRPVQPPMLFLELRGAERWTVRLHPRQGPDPAPGLSKMGGHFLWPADEPWPSCPLGQATGGQRHDQDRRFLEEEQARRHSLGDSGWALGQPHGAHVGVLQLHADDVPELGFPEGTDLFQLLWCPRDHPPQYCPDCRVFWRRAADVTRPLSITPVPENADNDLIPRPCVVAPERVIEYPNIADLPEELRQRIWAWEEGLADNEAELATAGTSAGAWSYQSHLSIAPGTKVGGYVSWVQDPTVPLCATCGTVMEHLLTVASWESDGASRQAWMPEEERTSSGTTRWRGQDGAGLMLGDAGDLYLFICRRCANWPIAWIHQCS